MTQPPDPGAGNRATVASTVYERLRRDIIAAELEPGQKLTIKSLCDRYGTGLSPMREALNRLSRGGLLIQTDRRGFSVSPLSEEHLAELTKTRIWLNEIALRESIAHGGQEWEEALVLSYYRLTRAAGPTGTSGRREETAARQDAHRQFHASLIAACGSTWMIRFCEQLFDAADRYRHVSRQVLGQQSGDRDDEHRLLMDAAISRDTDTAVELLRRHFSATAEFARGLTRKLAGAPVAKRGQDPRARAERKAKGRPKRRAMESSR
jgi:DNA-binding GntR family transcriptional regulator